MTTAWGTRNMDDYDGQDISWQTAGLSRTVAMLEKAAQPLSANAIQDLAREVIIRLDRSKRWRELEQTPGADQISELCDALLSPDPALALDLVKQACQAGMSADMLYLGYIAEATRLLGERWENDEVSFVDVSLGAGRVYGILRHLRGVFVTAWLDTDSAPRAVFAAVPGETHTVGVTMAADFMRRHGWHIDIAQGLDHQALIDEIGQSITPIIGLSASSSGMIFPLARLIVALRVSNPEAWIMVSGQIVKLEPEICQIVDADAVAGDAAEAQARMEAHMAHIRALRR